MHLITSLLVFLITLASAASAFKLTVWSGTNFGGTSRVYTTSGTKSNGFSARSYIWDSPPGDGCCVRFCSGSTSVGYRCSGFTQPSASAAFNKVVLGCGSATLTC